MTHRLRSLAQRVGSIDDRCDFAGLERLRILPREGPDPPRAAIDRALLPGPTLALIARRLGGAWAAQGTRRGLFEGEVGRLQRQRVFGGGRVVGKRAVAPAEDLV